MRTAALWIAIAVAILVAVVVGRGCVPDPANVIYRTKFDQGKPGPVEKTLLPSGASRPDGLAPPNKPAAPNPPALVKTHPALDAWLLNPGSAPRRPRLIVTLRRDEGVSGVDDLRITSDADLEAAIDAARARDATARAKLLTVVDDLGGDQIGAAAESLWLIGAVIIEIPREKIAELIDRVSDITYIAPVESGEPPPDGWVPDGDPTNDVGDARQLLGTDPYFAASNDHGRIALLDTGVQINHQLFNHPVRIGRTGNCVSGGPTCEGGSHVDGAGGGHGTSSAGIVSGNTNFSNDFQGVTKAIFDSWDVYRPTSFDRAAGVRGFQRAVLHRADVVLAEVQSDSGELSDISQSADAAFALGIVVVAPTGNFGSTSSVDDPNYPYSPGDGSARSPGNAHCALGIGNYDIGSGKPIPDQGQGPIFGRVKPDLRMPTNTETAAKHPLSNSALGVFGKTSGAAPYAAGVALLLRSWLRTHEIVDPGHVYALMILAGDNIYPFNNHHGAGSVELWKDGTLSWGKALVENGVTAHIDLEVPLSASSVDAALWWPECAHIWSQAFVHNDIDLLLRDPGGQIKHQSIDGGSVFERARAASPQKGVWNLLIQGYKVQPEKPQLVYWAAAVR